MFKAISTTGPEGIFEEIRSGKLFGQKLNEYLIEGCRPEEIHKFNEVLQNIKSEKEEDEMCLNEVENE